MKRLTMLFGLVVLFMVSIAWAGVYSDWAKMPFGTVAERNAKASAGIKIADDSAALATLSDAEVKDLLLTVVSGICSTGSAAEGEAALPYALRYDKAMGHRTYPTAYVYYQRMVKAPDEAIAYVESYFAEDPKGNINANYLLFYQYLGKPDPAKALQKALACFSQEAFNPPYRVIVHDYIKTAMANDRKGYLNILLTALPAMGPTEYVVYVPEVLNLVQKLPLTTYEKVSDLLQALTVLDEADADQAALKKACFDKVSVLIGLKEANVSTIEAWLKTNK